MTYLISFVGGLILMHGLSMAGIESFAARLVILIGITFIAAASSFE